MVSDLIDDNPVPGVDGSGAGAGGKVPEDLLPPLVPLDGVDLLPLSVVVAL